MQQVKHQTGFVNTVADLEGFLWFLQKPPLKPEGTLQDKFALKLYKPTNLIYTQQ